MWISPSDDMAVARSDRWTGGGERDSYSSRIPCRLDGVKKCWTTLPRQHGLISPRLWVGKCWLFPNIIRVASILVMASCGVSVCVAADVNVDAHVAADIRSSSVSIRTATHFLSLNEVVVEFSEETSRPLDPNPSPTYLLERLGTRVALSGLSAIGRMDTAVNNPPASSGSLCHAMFMASSISPGALLGADPRCYWQNAKTLIVQLGSQSALTVNGPVPLALSVAPTNPAGVSSDSFVHVMLPSLDDTMCANNRCGGLSSGRCASFSFPSAVGDTYQRCVCAKGLVGTVCDQECPTTGNSICHMTGVCAATHDSTSGLKEAGVCLCEAGWSGVSCEIGSQCTTAKELQGPSGSFISSWSSSGYDDQCDVHVSTAIAVGGVNSSGKYVKITVEDFFVDYRENSDGVPERKITIKDGGDPLRDNSEPSVLLSISSKSPPSLRLDRHVATVVRSSSLDSGADRGGPTITITGGAYVKLSYTVLARSIDCGERCFRLHLTI